MLNEKDRWEIQVLHRLGYSVRRIRGMTQHARNTIRKSLGALSPGAAPTDAASDGEPPTPKRLGRPSMIEPFGEFLLSRIKEGLSRAELLLEVRRHGFNGSRETLGRFLRKNKVNVASKAERAKKWMHLVLQGARTGGQVKNDIGDALAGDDISTLLTCVKTRPLKARNRALTVLARGNRIGPGQIAAFLCIRRNTVRRYLSDFKKGGIQCVLVRTPKGVRKAANPESLSSGHGE